MKTKTQHALLTAMRVGKLESQAQQNLIFKILNGANEDLKSEIKALFNDNAFEGFELCEDQNQKGYDWLLDQWKTPTGNEKWHTNGNQMQHSAKRLIQK
jgi:hypothetical protein